MKLTFHHIGAVSDNYRKNFYNYTIRDGNKKLVGTICHNQSDGTVLIEFERRSFDSFELDKIAKFMISLKEGDVDLTSVMLHATT